jgi:hypothetical protein
MIFALSNWYDVRSRSLKIIRDTPLFLKGDHQINTIKSTYCAIIIFYGMNIAYSSSVRFWTGMLANKRRQAMLKFLSVMKCETAFQGFSGGFKNGGSNDKAEKDKKGWRVEEDTCRVRHNFGGAGRIARASWGHF